MTDNAKIRARVNSLRILSSRHEMVIIRQVIVRAIIIISMRIVKPKICVGCSIKMCIILTWFSDPRIMSRDILANWLLNGSRVCRVSSALRRNNRRPRSNLLSDGRLRSWSVQGLRSIWWQNFWLLIIYSSLLIPIGPLGMESRIGHVTRLNGMAKVFARSTIHWDFLKITLCQNPESPTSISIRCNGGWVTSYSTNTLATEGRTKEVVAWSIRNGLPIADAIENNASLQCMK